MPPRPSIPSNTVRTAVKYGVKRTYGKSLPSLFDPQAALQRPRPLERVPLAPSFTSTGILRELTDGLASIQSLEPLRPPVAFSPLPLFLNKMK